VPYRADRPVVALLNANPFAEGIANLGAQVVADELLRHDFNVAFGFADTLSQGRLIGDPDLRACQVVAVSVPFEDTYHHVPRMLRALGLDPWSARRSDADPVLVAGGLALINPMPLSPFFDAMVIGEGRESIVEVCRLVEAARATGIGKPALLRRLAQVPHTFVPALYRQTVDHVGAVTATERDPEAPETVSPGRPLDMDGSPIHSIWTTERSCYKYPDYYSVMVAMGCHLKCPFCVVGNVQGEASGRARTIGLDSIVRLAEDRRRDYGTRLVKLFFASSFSSHPDIDPLNLKNLLDVMLTRDFECRVGSLNIKQADEELLALVRRAGQARVTFAPETGSTLRQSIGKPYSRDGKLLQVAAAAGRHDLGLDIYTMLGVPGEQPEHVDELAALIRDVRAALDPRQTLEVSINPAFSKAQTPYERQGTLRPEEIRPRFAYLRSRLPSEDGIEWVSVIDDAMAYYQPVLAMGGAELAGVLDRVSGSFSPTEAEWRTAVAGGVPGGDERYFRDRAPDEVLPWQHITYNSHRKLSLRLEAHRTRAARSPVRV
jgi:radical SAM superfamily enzyme YgiQ (UPF0313 family)